jgi:hypothetical protein
MIPKFCEPYVSQKNERRAVIFLLRVYFINLYKMDHIPVDLKISHIFVPVFRYGNFREFSSILNFRPCYTTFSLFLKALFDRAQKVMYVVKIWPWGLAS